VAAGLEPLRNDGVDTPGFVISRQIRMAATSTRPASRIRSIS